MISTTATEFRVRSIDGAIDVPAIRIVSGTLHVGDPAVPQSLEATLFSSSKNVAFGGAFAAWLFDATGIGAGGGNYIMAWMRSGTEQAGVDRVGTFVVFNSAGGFSWTSKQGIYKTADNVTSLRGSAGTEAQTLRIYNSFVSATSEEEIDISFSSNVGFVGTNQSGTGTARNIQFGTKGAATLFLTAGNVNMVSVDDLGNVEMRGGRAELTTGATDGFFYIPTVNGLSTGVPATAKTGALPLVFDRANNKLGVYDGAWIWTAALS